MRKFLRIAQIGFFSLDAATNFIKGLLLAFAIHKWIRVRISISLCHFWRRQNWSWTSMSWGHLKGGVETPNNENRNSSLGSPTPTFLLLKIGTRYQHCFPGCDCSVWKWIDRFVKVLLILWIKVHRCKLGRAICNLQFAMSALQCLRDAVFDVLRHDSQLFVQKWQYDQAICRFKALSRSEREEKLIFFGCNNPHKKKN